MRNRASISVIVPVYNTPITALERCIKSITKQAYVVSEIIVVDDGSSQENTKKYKKILSAYNNVKYIKKENGGASSARNIGLGEVDSDYVIMIDSDDEVCETYVGAMLDMAIKESVEIVYPHVISIKNTTKCGHFGFNKRKMSFPEDLEIFQHRNYCFSLLGALISTKRTREEAFDESLAYGEDIEYMMRLLKDSDFAYCDEAKYYYHQDSESAITTKDIAKIDLYLTDSIQALNKICSNYNNNRKIKTVIYSKLYNYINRIYGTDLSALNKRKKACKAVKAATLLRKNSARPGSLVGWARKILIDFRFIEIIVLMSRMRDWV